jgi:hypothetical protein
MCKEQTGLDEGVQSARTVPVCPMAPACLQRVRWELRGVRCEVGVVRCEV